MGNITWVNLLHFYQPPTASDQTIIEAAEKSYKRIIKALKKNPRIKFTLNLTGCLLARLDQLGYNELIADIKSLYEKRQVELTDTAAYHPILPLLPKSEVQENISANQAIQKKYFGQNFRAAGFFPPELAFSAKLAKIISSFGYQWIVLDEISAYGRLNRLDFNRLYLEKSAGLIIFFRQRRLSRSYVPETLAGLLARRGHGPVLTATDAELYGLRHNDPARTFEKLLKRPEIKTLTVSQFLAGLTGGIRLSPLASSWESTAGELKRGKPFILWHNNKIQKLLWRLAALAIKTVSRRQTDKNYFWARRHLNRGLSSCSFWWAAARDFKLFSSISWNPDEIERGAEELIKSLRSLAAPGTKLAKINGEKIYLKIKQLVWHKHWNYYWPKMKL